MVNWETSEGRIQTRILGERRGSKKRFFPKITYSKQQENHMTRKLLHTVSAMWTRGSSNIEAMQLLLQIEIKSTIKQEMYSGLKPVFSTNREPVKSNDSHHSIFERARDQKSVKAINQESKRESSWSDAIKSSFSINRQQISLWF
jgi:hypothetical protein